MKKLIIFSLLMTAGTCCVVQQSKAQSDIPLVYTVENTGADANPVLPDKDGAVKIDPLPDPLAWSDGSGRAVDFADWAKRRGEIAKEIQHYEIGVKPVVDASQVQARMEGNKLIVDVTVNGQTLQLSADIKYPSTGSAPYALMIGTSGISLPSAVFAGRPTRSSALLPDVATTPSTNSIPTSKTMAPIVSGLGD